MFPNQLYETKRNEQKQINKSARPFMFSIPIPGEYQNGKRAEFNTAEQSKNAHAIIKRFRPKTLRPHGHGDINRPHNLFCDKKSKNQKSERQKKDFKNEFFSHDSVSRTENR